MCECSPSPRYEERGAGRAARIARRDKIPCPGKGEKGIRTVCFSCKRQRGGEGERDERKKKKNRVSRERKQSLLPLSNEGFIKATESAKSWSFTWRLRKGKGEGIICWGRSGTRHNFRSVDVYGVPRRDLAPGANGRTAQAI